MQVKVGSYVLDANRVLLTAFNIQPIRSPRGRVIRLRKYFQIQGIITGVGSTVAALQADLTTKIAAAQTGLLNPDGVIGLFQDSGTVSGHSIDPATSDSGIRVGQLEWQKADGIEYATKRTFSINYSASYATTDDGDIGLIKYSSRYRLVGGGGAVFAGTELIAGSPIFETIHTASLRRAFQSGEAWGRDGYPLADSATPPIVGSEQGWQSSVENISPTEDEDGNLTNWGTHWQYSFEY